MDWPQNMQLLSVSFKPGGAYPFWQLPLSELHNQIISLDTIWGRWAVEIRERLYGAPTTQARFVYLSNCCWRGYARDHMDSRQSSMPWLRSHATAAPCQYEPSVTRWASARNT